MRMHLAVAFTVQEFFFVIRCTVIVYATYIYLKAYNIHECCGLEVVCRPTWLVAHLTRLLWIHVYILVLAFKRRKDNWMIKETTDCQVEWSLKWISVVKMCVPFGYGPWQGIDPRFSTYSRKAIRFRFCKLTDPGLVFLPSLYNLILLTI